jgi:hypothetical protein
MKLLNIHNRYVDADLDALFTRLHQHTRNPEFDFYEFDVHKEFNTSSAQLIINKNAITGSVLEAIALEEGLYVNGSRIHVPDEYLNQGILSRGDNDWWKTSADLRFSQDNQTRAVSRFKGRNRMEMHFYHDFLDSPNPDLCLYTPDMEFRK